MVLEMYPALREVVAVEASPIAYSHLKQRFLHDERVVARQEDFLAFADEKKVVGCEVITSIGSSHHLDTTKFLQAARALLLDGGVLLVADEMISKFSCRKSRKSSLLKHHLAYVADTLVEIPEEVFCDLAVQEVRGIELVRDIVPKALFEAVTGNADEANKLCRQLLESLGGLDFPEVISHPLVAFYRFHIQELEALVAGLDYEVERKVYPDRFIQLAKFAGFELLEHCRIYATDGESPADAGTHVYAFGKL